MSKEFLIQQLLPHSTFTKTEQRQRKRYDVKQQTKELLFCPKCNRAWELCRKDEGGIIRYNTGTIPSYGKERKECSICKKESRH